MRMADKADAERASLAAVTAVKGLVWLLRLFLSKVGSKGVLKGGYDLEDSAMLGIKVSSKCHPQVVVYVAGTEGLFKSL